MSTLVVAPHPDDETLGCAGTMAKAVSRRERVTVVVVTSGVRGLATAEMVDTVRAEFRTAMELLGVKSYEFWDFPAADLVTHQRAIADRLREVASRERTTRLLLPHGGDLHVDHQIVFNAGLVAARPLSACTVKEILTYETLSETDWAAPGAVFSPTVFEDISDHLQMKLQALACFQSQLVDGFHPRSLQAVAALATLRGRTVGWAAAEGFELVRSLRGQ